MRDDARANTRFFTPADLCERWQLSLRTLDKLDLPWTWVTPRLRRIAVAHVLAFENKHHLHREST